MEAIWSMKIIRISVVFLSQKDRQQESLYIVEMTGTGRLTSFVQYFSLA